MKGFDYRTDTACEMSPKEWREQFRHLVMAGGKRRVEDGETFGHDSTGKIVFEVYGRVAA